MILAGDIGATNTRLAIFDTGPKLTKNAQSSFISNHYTTLLPLVQEFLQQHKTIKISCAVFGIAGPVQNGRCQTTNLPWMVDSRDLEKELKIPSVTLLNDLEATAWGLKALKPSDFYMLHAGKKNIGNQALLVAGTGLGEAGLYWDGQQHCPFACEGGHTDFGPRNDLEIDLLRYLRKIYGHVSYERIISGHGLVHLYHFLVESKREARAKEVEHEMLHKDPAVVISEWGCQNRDAACKEAVDWFVSLYGAEAGNLALKTMALGGVFIGGKIAKVLIETIKKGGWIKAFIDKGRFLPLLKTIPVSIVLDDDAPLLGAAEYARAHHQNNA